jgi:class 3 adenylate cyclase
VVSAIEEKDYYTSGMTKNITSTVSDLLIDREYKALWISTITRSLVIVIMWPMVFVVGTGPFDQVGTSTLLAVYSIALVVSAVFLRRKRGRAAIALISVVLDILLLAALPFIWYVTLGASVNPGGILLKTSVTVFAFLFLVMSAFAMRPLYPALMTVGALLVHGLLLIFAMSDERTVFSTSYLESYTTAAVASGSIVTQFLSIAVVGLLLTLLTHQARRMILEATQLESTNVQLGRYFSPNLARQLADNAELLAIGGERKDLSFVFTDLAGFTTFVETNPPDVVVPILNDYLDELVQVIFAHDGTIDKIVGDAVHVIFGAPLEQPDHAARALRCAMAIDRAAQNFRYKQGGVATLGETRIGVNSGLAVVGNFGSAEMFDYTAHGDAINIAARLEAANKVLGTRVCVSAATVERVNNFIGRPVGLLNVRGVSTPTIAFEPIHDADEAISTLAEYRKAYAAIEQGDREMALDLFSTLAKHYPQDRLVAMHLRRLNDGVCSELIDL